jgi:signal transduction histidine kinase
MGASPVQNGFFQGFSEASVRALMDQSHPVEPGPGEILFEEGDPADFVLLVQKGQVDMFRRAGEREEVFATIGPGDYFGEVGILEGSTRAAGARTKTPVSGIKIPKEPLLDVLRKEPSEVTQHLFRRVFEYLRRTDERYMEEVVRKEKMQFIGEMASAIIHDFKNPITGIQLAAQLIEVRNPTEENRKWCGLIRQQADRMVGMAQELLDYSRGQPILNLQTVPIRSLFEQFVELNSDYLKESRVELSVRSTGDLIRVDGSRFLRILQNLAGNARDAMLAGGGGRISLIAERNGAEVEIRVEDNGPGIPEQIRDRLFEPFVTHGKTHGTGLGMAITKAFVEAHGGSIRFETETGRGTVFFVRLPIAESTPPHPS